MAHCATEGHAYDLDIAEESKKPPMAPCFELWKRMMSDPKYEKLLTADISAVTAFKRVQYLADIIDREFHSDRRGCTFSDVETKYFFGCQQVSSGILGSCTARTIQCRA